MEALSYYMWISSKSKPVFQRISPELLWISVKETAVLFRR